ncbi:MAG: D-alanyl-D-alanine carboxypeptidase family protein [Clostridiaceae bacterium]|jgi:D-alanyl-D-alanine carboxypeptidase (penicillin-binding protein 5/6)|nr:D-alanyl-D-alanine carboxypeptidase family protein [Clostridiaceae bacterium]
MRAYAVEQGASAESTPQLQSETAVLMDAETGQILFQKDMNERMYPASITKIMTGMLALKNAKLTDVITMSYDAVFSIDRGSSHVALDVAEQITLEQALYALSIESANDAANGIAELVGGSMENFATMMNAAAEECGAKNTRFVNAHGLFDESHYTTAYDMAKITAQAIKVPGFTDFFSADYYEVPPTNKQPDTRYFRNRNKLLNGEVPYEGIVMSKTGWTTESQNTLVTVAERGETTLIAVVMKSSMSSYKWDDTVKMLDYGFSQFYPTQVSIAQLASQLNLDPGTEIAEPSTLALLLPNGITTKALTAHLDWGNAPKGVPAITVPLCLQIGTPAEPEDDLLETQVAISSAAALEQNVGKTDNQSEDLSKGQGKNRFPIVVAILAVVVVVVIIALYVLHLRANYLRRKRRMQRRKRQAQERRNTERWDR